MGKHNKSKRYIDKRKNNKEHFDYGFTNNILALAEEDPFFAIPNIEKYLETHVDDYRLNSAYCSLLVSVGRYDESLKQMDILLNKMNNDKNFLKQKVRYDETIDNIKFTKFRILINTGKHKEALDYLVKNQNRIKGKNIDDITIGNLKFFLLQRLGRIRSRDAYSGYYLRQIVEYSEEDFLDHIKRHFEDYECDNPSNALFYREFPFEKVYEEITKIIPNDCCLHRGFTDEKYFFKFDNCGRIDNKPVDFFSVAVFNDTKKIITISPCEVGKCLPYTDLNYLKQIDTTKIRKISQIDKFNKKYNIK